jgi:putative SOS response-associated peptidase YedK
MCGRYASFLPAEAIARIFGTVNPLPNLSPSWNVAPTQGATVVRRHPDTGGPTSICWSGVCCRTECRLRLHPLLSGRARSGFRPED